MYGYEYGYKQTQYVMNVITTMITHAKTAMLTLFGVITYDNKLQMYHIYDKFVSEIGFPCNHTHHCTCISIYISNIIHLITNL